MPTSSWQGMPNVPGMGGTWRAPGPSIGMVERPEPFDASQYASSLGMQWRTPTGQALPTARGALPSFIQKTYGMGPGEFFGATEQERYQAYAGEVGAAGTYEEMPTEGGRMTRPPKTPQEASWAQFAETQAAQQEKQQRQESAMSILRHQLGMLRKGGAGSLAEFASPVAGQMAAMEAAYEPEIMDYSYWLTPGAYGVSETTIPEPEEGPQMWGEGPTVGAAQQTPQWSRHGHPTAGGRSTAGMSYF